MRPLLLILAAYMCGSLPVGVWVARAAGVDIRRMGSGNVGATNVGRVIGVWASALTLVGDAAKGFVPTLIAGTGMADPWLVAGVGLAALLGHVRSVFLRFSGGKGVATAAGVFLAAAPLAIAVVFTAFLAVALSTRYVSAASLVAAIVLPAAVYAFGYPPATCTAAIAATATIVLRHRANIQRLARGREPRFHFSRRTGG